jgi:hypothetical protein
VTNGPKYIEGVELSEAEREAIDRLLIELRDLSELARGTRRLLMSVVRNVIGREPLAASVACIHLTNRSYNDLRAAQVLAIHGYCAQSCAVTASLFDSALSAAYIGARVNRAEAWFAHADPVNPFQPTAKLAANFVSQGPKEMKGERLHRVYRELCRAKHANPTHQDRIGKRTAGERTHLFNGPDLSHSATETSRFALAHGSRIAGLAAIRVADAFALARGARTALRSELKPLREQYEAAQKLEMPGSSVAAGRP